MFQRLDGGLALTKTIPSDTTSQSTGLYLQLMRASAILRDDFSVAFIALNVSVVRWLLHRGIDTLVRTQGGCLRPIHTSYVISGEFLISEDQHGA